MGALESLPFIYPELTLLGFAFAMLVIDFFVANKSLIGCVAFLGIVCAAWVSIDTYHYSGGLFFGYFQFDAFTRFFRIISWAATELTVLAALSYDKIPGKQRGEFYFLLVLFAALLPLMAAAANLLMVFLAIESVSMTSYILTGFQKFDKKSSEASLKYLLFGSVSSATMLFGMSLLFGATGTIWLAEIGARLQSGGLPIQSIGLIGLLFLLVGIGFKISMVPFHMWAPDVYQGAPTPVTALLTVAPKALGFAVMVRVLLLAFPVFMLKWSHLLVWLSILTMTVGNVIAISQSDIKRLLAYSSIAQAGYMLVGLATPGLFGQQALLIYILAYLFTNLGAFITVLAAERTLTSNQLEDYRGLSQRNPLLAMCLTIFLLSLTGIPPLAGFIGKLYIFSTAIKSNQIILAIAIALNSAIAAYYYFKIVRMMYLEKPNDPSRCSVSFPVKLAITITLIATVVIGIFPGYFIQFISSSLPYFPSF